MQSLDTGTREIEDALHLMCQWELNIISLPEVALGIPLANCADCTRSSIFGPEKQWQQIVAVAVAIAVAVAAEADPGMYVRHWGRSLPLTPCV